MKGTIAWSEGGNRWQFILECFGANWTFPFEFGPSCDSELPGARTLEPGEVAELAPLGTVLVTRDGQPRYAGRIDIRRRVVQT